MNGFRGNSRANRQQDAFRLLAVTPLFPPSAGGAAEDFRLLADAWQQCGDVHSVVILTERRKGSPAREKNGKVLTRRLLPPRDTQPGSSAAARLIRSALTYPLLACLIVWHSYRGDSQVTLLHGRYGRKGFLRVLKLCGIKTAVFLSDHYTSPEALADCDAIICNAENVLARAACLSETSPKTVFIPFPFTLEIPQITASRLARFSEPYYLFVGTVSRAKGVDILLKAFDAFRAKNEGYRLLLAGPIRDVVLRAEAGSGTTFLDEVDHTTILALMKHARAVVLPSRSEALPRVCLEAMALGTKVICPPGVPELERACPQWVLSGITVEEVLQKLNQANDSPFQGCYDFEKHSPASVGQQVLGVCAAILNARGAP